MENNVKQEEAKAQPTNTVGNVNEGSKSSTDSLIERSDNIAKRMEEANKRAEELIKRQEEILARQRLDGRAFAGQPVQTVEEKQKADVEAEAKKILSRYGK